MILLASTDTNAHNNRLLSKLLITTDRPDGSQSNLRGTAYEALMKLDCYATVQETIVVILQRLNTVLTVHIWQIMVNWKR
jgi:hypothetical protein